MNVRVRSLLFLFAAPLVPILMGADGCGSSHVIGRDTCAASECGPALGLPIVTCADGSVGGSTGQCLEDADGVCRWEVRECPPLECTEDLCGPRPPTLPGTLLSCEAAADGSCGWVVTSDPACEAADCGPAPGTPSWVCADGSIGGFTGQCITQADGSCGWEIRDCEVSDECTLDECGPMPGSPAIVCADGSIGGNTGRCLRSADGACGWEMRECPDPSECGGFSGAACDAGEVCIYAAGECGIADGTGTCVVPPTGCSREIHEVCGCDGVTYSNPCLATASGASIDHDGACDGTVCGGFGGAACAAGEYCHYGRAAMCGATDATGTCQPIPPGCPDNVAPVCGCDGVTYFNACEAAAAGVSVASDGECPGTGTECGGFAGNTCPPAYFCQYDVSAMCGALDAPGHCELIPVGCPDNVAPVCGCDGVTYSNACEAAAAGASVASEGACGGFSCGPGLTCAEGEYCAVTIPGVPGAPRSYACSALPSSCLSLPTLPTCASCFPSGDCSADAAGHLTLTLRAP